MRKSCRNVALAVGVAGLAGTGSAAVKTYIGTNGDVNAAGNWLASQGVPAWDGTDDIVLGTTASNGGNPRLPQPSSGTQEYKVHSVARGANTGSQAYVFADVVGTSNSVNAYVSFNGAGAFIESTASGTNYLRIAAPVVLNVDTEIRTQNTGGSSSHGALKIEGALTGVGNLIVKGAAPGTYNWVEAANRQNHAGKLVVDEGYVRTLQLWGTVEVLDGGYLATGGNMTATMNGTVHLKDGSTYELNGNSTGLSYVLSGTTTINTGGSARNMAATSGKSMTGSGLLIKKGSGALQYSATGTTYGYTGAIDVQEGSLSGVQFAANSIHIVPSTFVDLASSVSGNATWAGKLTGSSAGSTATAAAGSFATNYGFTFGPTAVLSPGGRDTGAGLPFAADTLRFFSNAGTSTRNSGFQSGAAYKADITGASSNDLLLFTDSGGAGSHSVNLANGTLDVYLWTPAADVGSAATPVQWTVLSVPDGVLSGDFAAINYRNADGSALDGGWTIVSDGVDAGNQNYVISAYYAATAVPEPAGLGLLGLAGLALVRRRRA